MDREALWQVLAGATDAVQAAGDEFNRAPTAQALAAMKAAFHEYVQRLSPVIGHVEAFRYEASLATYQEVIERMAFADTTDSALVRQLTEERAAAARAFGGASVALEAALRLVQARDNEPDEQGRA